MVLINGSIFFLMKVFWYCPTLVVPRYLGRYYLTVIHVGRQVLRRQVGWSKRMQIARASL